MNGLKLKEVDNFTYLGCTFCTKVQVGNDQEKAQSRNSHSKNRGGKNAVYNVDEVTARSAKANVAFGRHCKNV